MHHLDCRAKFVLLATGGVRVVWACGAELVDAAETAIDIAVLRDRYPDHHHRRYRHE